MQNVQLTRESPSSAPAARGQSGALLRHWRTVRRVTQLELALEAGISTRHLSYMETGRAQPSREMVLRLAEALQVPLRERNMLLLAAGYAPLYRETGLDAPDLAEARRALQLILTHQEPYPAIVIDRYWNMLLANAATERFLALYPECSVPGPRNGPRMLFHPQGLRPFVVGWEEVASRLIQRVHREAAGNPSDSATKALLEELLSYPDVPARWRTPDLDHAPPPLLTISYRYKDLTLSFFSTITTFGTPQDITLHELRIECFYPADDVTRAAVAELSP